MNNNKKERDADIYMRAGPVKGKRFPLCTGRHQGSYPPPAPSQHLSSGEELFRTLPVCARLFMYLCFY